MFPSVPVFVPVYKCRNSFIYQQIFINVPVVPVFFISYIISVSEVCIFCREQREQRGTRGDRGKMEEGKQVNWSLASGSGSPPVGGGVSVSPAGSVKRFCLAAEAVSAAASVGASAARRRDRHRRSTPPEARAAPQKHRNQHLLITNDYVGNSFLDDCFKQFTRRGVETPPPTVRWFKPRDKLQLFSAQKTRLTLFLHHDKMK